jgi:hypothetical protein
MEQSAKPEKQDLVQHYDVIEHHERTSHGGTIINTHLASQQAKQNKNEKPLIFIIQKINGTKKNLKKNLNIRPDPIKPTCILCILTN